MRVSNEMARHLMLAAIFTTLMACDGSVRKEDSMVKQVVISAAEWESLAHKRVIFGHQSVGQNIIDGVQALAAGAKVALPVVRSRSFGESAGIMHFYVGENENAVSKLRDFSNALESGGVRPGDAIMVKFCYLDFNRNTDSRRLAGEYVDTLDRLGRRFPDASFVAVTAPLTVVQTGPKAWVKRILGREPSGYGDNARRLEFNNLLRARYRGSGQLFDLAAIEAQGTGENQYEGQTIESLNSSLTYDDGHLSAHGAQVVGAHLVKYLAALPGRR